MGGGWGGGVSDYTYQVIRLVKVTPDHTGVSISGVIIGNVNYHG